MMKIMTGVEAKKDTFDPITEINRELNLLLKNNEMESLFPRLAFIFSLTREVFFRR